MEIRIVQGSIERMYDYEGIVNPTTPRLDLGKGGIARALRRHGEEGLAIGIDMARQLAEGGRIPIGKCVVTGAGYLANRNIFHVVLFDPEVASTVPVTRPVVRACVAAALARADEERIASLAFPVLGPGSGRMPFEQAVEAMLDELQAANPVQVQRVGIVVPDAARFGQVARRYPALGREVAAPEPGYSASSGSAMPRPRKHASATPGRPPARPPPPAKGFAEILATSAGRPERRYGPGCPTPTAGDRLAHPVFGVGIVTAIRGDKWDVLFAPGLKTLKRPA